MNDRFLPGVPGSLVEEMFNNAPGNEIATGKFDSPESSAALAANAFGFFLCRPQDLLRFRAAIPRLGQRIRWSWSGR